MTRLRDIDLLSVGIGVILGVLILASGLHIRQHRIERGERPVRAAEQKKRSRLAEQVRLESHRQNKAQQMLDKVIGEGRSLVRVAIDWEDRDGVTRVKRLSLSLGVDQTKVGIDPDTREIREQLRPEEEVDQLAALVQQAVGFDATRGDAMTVSSIPFDKTQQIQQHEQATSQERREFWTGIVVVGPLLLLALYLFRRGGMTGTAIAVGAGAALVLSPIGLRDGPAVAFGLGVFFLIVGIDRWRQIQAKGEATSHPESTEKSANPT